MESRVRLFARIRRMPGLGLIHPLQCQRVPSLPKNRSADRLRLLLNSLSETPSREAPKLGGDPACGKTPPHCGWTIPRISY